MLDIDDDDINEICTISPTIEQQQILDGQMSISSLEVADFLGIQSYIWIQFNVLQGVENFVELICCYGRHCQYNKQY
jgi:hypothetical protein